MKIVLNDEVQLALRSKNIISNLEVVYKFGDIFIAENIVRGTRRQLTNLPSFVLEAADKPALLKG